jgi:hypothetical protein
LQTTLANNPSLIDQIALFVAQFLKDSSRFFDVEPLSNSHLCKQFASTPAAEKHHQVCSWLVLTANPIGPGHHFNVLLFVRPLWLLPQGWKWFCI